MLDQSVPSEGNGETIKGGARLGSRLRVCLASDVEIEPLEWLWPNRIPQNKFSLIVGDPGLGKSIFTCVMAAHVSTGRNWPVDHSSCPLGDVIMISGEDDLADTICPRLIAANADRKRIHFVQMARDFDPKTNTPRERGFSLQRDLEALTEALEQRPNTKLVIFDPITAYLDGVDTHRNSEVRGLLAPLAALAAERKVAIVAVSHLNKTGHSNALYRTSGSLAFIAAARSALLVCKDQDDPTRRLILCLKNNLGPEVDGLAYRVADAGSGVAQLEWEPDRVAVSANEALNESEDTRSALDEAEDWLKAQLKDGPVASSELKIRGEKDGIAWRTIRRAKDVLKVKAKKLGFQDKDTAWVWELSDNG